MNPREDIYPMHITEKPLLEASFRPHRTPLALLPGANKSLDPFLGYEAEQSYLDRSSLLSNQRDSTLNNSANPLYRTMEGSPQFTREERELYEENSFLKEEVSSLQRRYQALREDQIRTRQSEIDREVFSHHLNLSELENDKQSKIIQELRKEIEVLSLRNAEILQNFRENELELGYTKGEITELRKELQKTEADLSAYKNDIKLLAKEKINVEMIRDQLKEELGTAKANIKLLKDQIAQLKETSNSAFKIQKLEEKIKDLNERNDNLQLELNCRPSHKQHRETVSRLKELETQGSNKSRSVTPKRNVERQNSGAKLKSLMKELKVENIDDAISVVRTLKQNAGKELISKLTSLVADCMPEGSFVNEPSHKQIWKWIRMVVGDVIQLKKELAKGDEAKALLNRLQGVLGVEEIHEINDKVLEIVGELHSLKNRLSM